MLRSSQFKYKAQRLNEIKKPTPLREGGGLNLHSCGAMQSDELKSDPLLPQFNRRSSQFCTPANNDKSCKSESNFKEDGDEVEAPEEERFNIKNVPIEQSLLQSNLN